MKPVWLLLLSFLFYRPFWNKPKLSSVGTTRGWVYQRSQPQLVWTVSERFTMCSFVLGMKRNSGKLFFFNLLHLCSVNVWCWLSFSWTLVLDSFTVGTIDVGKARLMFWDLGGQEELQSLWDKVSSNTSHIVRRPLQQPHTDTSASWLSWRMCCCFFVSPCYCCTPVSQNLLN